MTRVVGQRTSDRLPDSVSRAVHMRDRMFAFYAAQKLGKTRYLTPEGYLVCEGVPIARTGEQTYREDELNRSGEKRIRGDRDGIVVVRRKPEDVFHPDTVRSFEGKAITVEHPSTFLSPDTIRQHQVGHVQHVRRGDGIEDDLLVGDFVITDPEAIAYVNRALPEVSAGYCADYAQDEPGIAYQRSIFGNHVALVERGRAGPRVSIKDSLKEYSAMTDKTKSAGPLRTRDRLLDAVPVGKAIAPGMLWEGNLQPRLDFLKDQVKELVTGFTIGQRLDPEGPGHQIDAGRVWDGITQRITALENEVRDALVALAVSQGKKTSDARTQIRDNRIGSFGRSTSPSEVNQLNKDFWAKQQATADNARPPDPIVARPGASSIAAINEANRRFWAARQ